jgi:uncharacterized protein DUF2190
MALPVGIPYQTGNNIDYLPAAAKSQGDIVFHKGLAGLVVNDITAEDIAAANPGALQITEGVKVKKAAGAGVTFAIGDPVYYDEPNTNAVATPSTFQRLGTCIKAAANGDDRVVVKFNEHTLQCRGGQHTTIDENDTVVTGLSNVVAVVASFDDDPVDGAQFVTASIGDQAGAPAAGSVLIKTWKNTDADATHVAATTFTKKVNWIAWGF